MSPPLIRGGQGRSDRDVRESATLLAWMLGALLVAILASIFLPD